MRALSIAVVFATVAACAKSDTVPGTDGGGAVFDAATHDASVHDAAVSGSDASDLDAAVSGNDASPSLDAATPGACLLPAVSGNCDAYFERYAFDADAGACVKFVYGGCGGNANNFETPLACLEACAPGAAPSTGASACKVGDSVFPSGAADIQDPHSCNSCSCDDGRLLCTEIGCPQACPPNSKESTGCAACGPVDDCEIVEYGCFPVCDTQADCTTTDYPVCLDNACRNVCG